METTHIDEKMQEKFQCCVARAIDLFFMLRISVPKACEMTTSEMLNMRSPEVAASALEEPIWNLLEYEVADKLREIVGLKEKEPIIQTPVKTPVKK